MKCPSIWIERDIEKVLREIATQYPVAVLTRTRKVGKTSLLTHSFPDIAYSSLDVPFDAERAETQSGLFLEQLGRPCLIDEVQYAPALFRSIKAVVDSLRPQKGLYYLTSSERYHLMEGVSESLAGRAAIIELHSLSHRELERATGKESSGQQLLEWIWMGGYPAHYSEHIPCQRYYSNLLATYIERDVRRLAHVQNLRDFDRFLSLTALRTGQLLSMNALASEVGVSQTTIKNWISVLVSSGIVSLVEP
jgi:predicted AAA+ superfamily ATPase